VPTVRLAGSRVNTPMSPPTSCRLKSIRRSLHPLCVLVTDERRRLRTVMEAKLRERDETRVESRVSEPASVRSVEENSGMGALLRASVQMMSTPSTAPRQTSATMASNSPFTTTSPNRGVERGLERGQRSPSLSSVSDGTPDQGYFGESSTFAFVSKVQPPVSYTRNNNKRRRLSSTRSAKASGLDDIGLSPPQESDCYELPPKHLADSLLDAYFARVHRLYPYVHEPSFRLDYERTYLQDVQSLATSRPLWIGLLNMIFAHGAEFCSLVPEKESVATASRFVNKARRIVFSHIFKGASLELVQALLLLCQYLQSTLELNECWSLVGLLIRTAIGLGLHLNPSQSDGMTCLEREFRIRTWWGCFIIDRTLSMKFGRPPTIDEASAFDVDLPLEVDDQYINQGSVAPRQPENRPSLITFFTRTILMIDIMGKVLSELYHPRRKTTNKRGASTRDAATPSRNATHSYIISHSVLLDAELVSWLDQVPAHLKQKPEIPDGPEFELQRNVLLTRYINLRLLVHRQTFLIFSKHNIEDPFQRAVAIASCRVCISTARQVIEVIHENHHRRMLNSLWYSLHYVFTAMGVLLSLRTMDKARLDAIGEGQDDRALELGMEFLRAASRISTLAARYMAMLKRIWTGSVAYPSQRSSPRPVDPTGLDAAPATGSATVLTQDGAAWSMDPPDDLVFDDLGMIDFNNDLLFGTGLPRDLLSTDWSTFGLSL
jgi:hypothetical protein